MNVWKVVVASVLVSLLRTAPVMPEVSGKLVWQPDCHQCGTVLAVVAPYGTTDTLTVYINPKHVRQEWITTGNIYHSPDYLITTHYWEIIRKPKEREVADGEGAQWPEAVYNYQRVVVDVMPPLRNNRIHWIVVREGPEGWLVTIRTLSARPVAVSLPSAMIAQR